MFTATLEGVEEFEAEVREFERALRSGTENAVGAACKAGVEAAKKGRFKDHTGDLRREIYWVYTQSSNAGVEAEMRSPMKYSSYVEAGTEPHIIEARRKKSLRWEDADGTHFARRVHHPGSKSIPFMGPAYHIAERVLAARMETVGVEAGKVFK
jgi:hypothetical protein